MSTSLRGLAQALGTPDDGTAAEDPLGVGVQAQARDNRFRPSLQGLASAVPMNPQWDAYFQALSNASGGKDIQIKGGPSAPGSTQLTGLGPAFTPDEIRQQPGIERRLGRNPYEFNPTDVPYDPARRKSIYGQTAGAS